MRMTELAGRVLESKSRLSHHVGRLEAEGLVRRESCPNDRRGMFAVLTPAGRRRLQRAAPDHVASVRRHFVDRLDRAQLVAVADALEAVGGPLLGPAVPTRSDTDCGGLSGPAERPSRAPSLR
jgi:DNA-binding MarR family transcriptional regulator